MASDSDAPESSGPDSRAEHYSGPPRSKESDDDDELFGEGLKSERAPPPRPATAERSADGPITPRSPGVVEDDELEALSASELELVRQGVQSVPGMDEIVERVHEAVVDETAHVPDGDLPGHERQRLVPKRKRVKTRMGPPGVVAPPDSQAPPPPVEGPQSVPNVLELARKTMQSMPPPVPKPRAPIEDDLFEKGLLQDQLTKPPVETAREQARSREATPSAPGSRKGRKKIKSKPETPSPAPVRARARKHAVLDAMPADRASEEAEERPRWVVPGVLGFVLGVLTTLAVERVLDLAPRGEGVAPVRHEVVPTVEVPRGEETAARDPSPTLPPSGGGSASAPASAAGRPTAAPVAAPTASMTAWDELPPELVGGAAAGFDRAAADAALTQAAAAATGCADGEHTGKALVMVTFDPSGAASQAVLAGGSELNGTAVGSCIVRTMKRARVKAFSGDPVSLTKTVTIR
jgi:hypothetical protein